MDDNYKPLRMTTLDDLGMPHIRVYSNGVVQNLLTGVTYKDGPYLYLSTFEDKKPVKIAKKKLMGWCFNAPWRTEVRLQYKHLAFLGCSNYYAVEDGNIFATWWMQNLHQDISPDGYPEVVITRDDKTVWYTKTHRVIAMAFVPNPENKDTVNHIDGNKMNNHPSNLEWMWNWENMDHALKTGLKHSAMTDEMVHKACQLLEKNIKHSVIAKIVGCEPHNIKDILDGCHYRIARKYSIKYPKNARHIPKEFLGEVEYL